MSNTHSSFSATAYCRSAVFFFVGLLFSLIPCAGAAGGSDAPSLPPTSPVPDAGQLDAANALATEGEIGTPGTVGLAVPFGCSPYFLITGEASKDRMGQSVSGAGDVNNDGFDDVIVGAPLNSAAAYRAGRAYVYSGRTGTLLYTFTGDGSHAEFGTSVSGAGDVNNDGFDDVIVGAIGRAAAMVYSGSTGALLYTLTGGSGQFGRAVSGAGDVNNDGFDDVIVGEPYYSDGGNYGAGRAYIFSGQSGALLYIFSGEGYLDLLGRAVSGAGDVNNDGFDDVVVGAALNNDGVDSTSGRAIVYSGQDGSILYTFPNTEAFVSCGYSVSGAGDVNNDGFDDVVMGAAYTNALGVAVYSGQSGALLYMISGLHGGVSELSVSIAGDVNGDGFDDVVVGVPFPDQSAYVYSGRTGLLLSTLVGEPTPYLFAWSVSGAGDVNNDGYADVVVGAIGTTQSTGWAFVFACSSSICYCPFQADLNADTLIDATDLASEIDVVFFGTSGLNDPGCPTTRSDLNNDGVTDAVDLSNLIDYIYFSGSPPVDPCFP